MTLAIRTILYMNARTDLLRWVKNILRLIAVGLGSVHAWAAATSHSMNADGVSYLDIGDAIFHGDWATGLSAVWSPLYAWILGAVMRLFDPPMEWEFPLVHIVNYLIFLFALVCFEFFWRQLVQYHQKVVEKGDGQGLTGWPDWMFWAVGYLLFITATLTLIEIWSVTPDMLMAAFVLLASGLLVKIRLGSSNWRIFLLLGLVLGVGYLAKEIMMPVAILFLGIAFFTVEDKRLAVRYVPLILVSYLLVTVPYSLVFSAVRGDTTFGGAASFTYAKHVNGVPFAHWQGLPPGSGTPEHPTRQIFDEPPIYEFATPVAGTYPVSFDPAYWNAGLTAHFDLRQQLDALIVSGLFYLDLLFYQYGALLIGVVSLYILGRYPSLRLPDFLSRWGLVVVALAVFGFYGIVLVSGRYIGVFVILFWADLLANIRLPDSQALRKLVPILGSLIIIFLLANLVSFSLSGYQDLGAAANAASSMGGQAPEWPGEVAQALLDSGLQAGDPVAIIGYGFDSFWARLARVKIVAEMPINEAELFWTAGPELQMEVIEAFANSGAKAIVAETVPDYASLPGWEQVGNSNYYILRFNE